MKKYIVLLLFISFSTKIQPQSYFPLSVGNKFVFKYSYETWIFPGYQESGYYYRTLSVLEDSVILGKKYYYISWFPNFSYQWLRVDSITGSLYRFEPTNSCPFYNYESLVDSFSMLSGTENDCSGWQFGSINSDSTFGQTTTKKSFYYYSGITMYGRTFNSLLGLIGYTYSVNGYHYGTQGEGVIRGCIINGVVFGDTTVTDLKNTSTYLPQKYSLYQNYPNPFNPVTKINYELPKDGKVKLVVYDILGREIKTLVNELKHAGKYSVDFNGSQYSSGVYFYRIQIDGRENITDVKKMVLIK